MVKWFLMAMTLLNFSTVSADCPPMTLIEKVIFQNADGYFILSDGSCWKTVGYVKRWRTPSEWWNNVELVPENYNCLPKDWAPGAPITSYMKYQNLNVDEANASNQEVLKQCTHLLVNNGTGQVLFATPLYVSDCMTQVYKAAKEEGYAEGLAQGHSDSSKVSDELYEKARSSGFQAGYAQGRRDAEREFQPGGGI